MSFTKTPFKINSFRANGFNPSPFSVTPFELKSFKEKPFQTKPFNLTPFLKYPFNNPNNDKLWTPLERIQYQQYMRSQLPSKKARDYFKNQREYQEYLKNKREQEQAQEQEGPSTLADHKKGTEINSLRDVLLGMHNPHMEHAIEEIPEWLGLLNVIPDTLTYWYKFYYRPIVKGKPMHTLINVLTEFAEDIDAITLTTPVKAIAQALVNGDDVWENLQAATFGTEEGIKNFDWDTGNGWADLGLEIASDPTNYIPLFGWAKAAVTAAAKGSIKTALKGLLKVAAKELPGELGEQAVKTFGDDFAEGIAKIVGKEVTSESVEQSLLKGFDEVWTITKTGLNKEDAYKQIVNKTIKKEVKGAKQKLNTLQDILKINEWESFKNLDEAFNHRFIDNLININKLDPKQANAILEYVQKSGITKTVLDLTQDGYNKLSSNILMSLSNKLHYVDDLLMGTVVKTKLTPLLVYPTYRYLKRGKLFKATLKHAVKQNQQILVNKFKESAKAPGSFLYRVTDTDIETAITKRLVLGDSVDPLLKQNAVQSALVEFGSALADFIHLVRSTILPNKSMTAAQKRAMLLENIKAIKQGITTERGIIKYLKEADRKISKARSKHDCSK